mmetsp:Transcript_19622/g.52298  ORF Transcript_19622/g.52298 Transcript_19622/m.52298 type:complete len:220 (-) Transcript_19622:9-668(-)
MAHGTGVSDICSECWDSARLDGLSGGSWRSPSASDGMTANSASCVGTSGNKQLTRCGASLPDLWPPSLTTPSTKVAPPTATVAPPPLRTASVGNCKLRVEPLTLTSPEPSHGRKRVWDSMHGGLQSSNGLCERGAAKWRLPGCGSCGSMRPSPVADSRDAPSAPSSTEKCRREDWRTAGFVSDGAHQELVNVGDDSRVLAHARSGDCHGNIGMTSRILI